VSGFGQGGKFFVSECAVAVDMNAAGCGLQLAAQPVGLTNNSGQGSLTFKVSSTATAKPYNTVTTETCTTGCVLGCDRWNRFRICLRTAELCEQVTSIQHVPLPAGVGGRRSGRSRASCPRATHRDIAVVSDPERLGPVAAWPAPSRTRELSAQWHPAIVTCPDGRTGPLNATRCGSDQRVSSAAGVCLALRSPSWSTIMDGWRAPLSRLWKG